jgi:hypothetical protein
MRDDEMGGVTDKIEQDRAKINAALLLDTGGRFPSCHVCHIVLIPMENNSVYFCSGCGLKLPLNKVKYEGQVKSRYDGKSKPMIQSQGTKKDKPDCVKESTCIICTS